MSGETESSASTWTIDGLHRKLWRYPGTMRGIAVMSWLIKLYQAWRHAKTPVILPLVLMSVGVVALVLGTDASKAFTDVGGGAIIRIMGAAMLLGAMLIISSIIKPNPTREMCGLILCMFGAAVYGGGVIVGLHAQGIIAGLGYAGIALTLLGRLINLLFDAQEQERARHGD